MTTLERIAFSMNPCQEQPLCPDCGRPISKCVCEDEDEYEGDDDEEYESGIEDTEHTDGFGRNYPVKPTMDF